MLPFHISELFGLRFETHGIVLVGEDGLRLVFRDADDQPRFLDGKTESVLIRWDQFAGLQTKKGLFSHQVTLQLHATAQPENLPGLSEHQVRLAIQKRHADQMESFRSQVEKYQAGGEAEDVDDFIDDVRRFLDKH